MSTINFYLIGEKNSARKIIGMPISTYYSGNGGAKFSKNIWVPPEFEGIACGVGAAASSIKARSFVLLDSRVKEKCMFWGRGESLIF
jgi:hypothetical protein